MSDVTIWTEKWRPHTLDDYVWRDSDQRAKIEEWIAAGRLPSHLIFCGPPGVGKTSLAKLLLRELKIPSSDILTINATRERSIDTLRNIFENFTTTWAMGETGIKYIIFDEAESFLPFSQRSLLSDLETYSETLRVIFTCNNVGKLIAPLQERCQKMVFDALGKQEFLERIATILDKENVDFFDADGEITTLQKYIDLSYPSMRNCINLVQENIVGGKLMSPRANEVSVKDYVFQMVALFQTKQYKEARELIIQQAQPEDYPDIYRFFYQNLAMFTDDQEKQDDILLIISNGVYRHSIVSDQEINLSATIMQICRAAR